LNIVPQSAPTRSPAAPDDVGGRRRHAWWKGFGIFASGSSRTASVPFTLNGNMTQMTRAKQFAATAPLKIAPETRHRDDDVIRTNNSITRMQLTHFLLL